MRKFLGLSTVLMALAATANANVWVSWQADAGFYLSANPSVGMLSLGQSALAQLIWSPDNVANQAWAINSGSGYVSGGDVMLASRILTNDGSLGADYAFFGSSISDDHGSVGGAPTTGFVYARIFQDDTPQAGDWYLVGEIVAAQNLIPPVGTPQSYNLNRDSNNGDAIDGEFSSAVVVPEPASISLLVLGAAVLGLRRRRR